MSAISRFARLRGLSREERGLLACALVLLPLTALGLRLTGLRRVQRALERMSPLSRRGGTHGDPAIHAMQSARMVFAAARHGPYRATCLPTALALQSLLRRRGIHTDLRLGVRKDRGRFEAHAWLEHRGIALIDSVDVGEYFSAFAEPIGNAAVRAR